MKPGYFMLLSLLFVFLRAAFGGGSPASITDVGDGCQFGGASEEQGNAFVGALIAAIAIGVVQFIIGVAMVSLVA